MALGIRGARRSLCMTLGRAARAPRRGGACFGACGSGACSRRRGAPRAAARVEGARNEEGMPAGASEASLALEALLSELRRLPQHEERLRAVLGAATDEVVERWEAVHDAQAEDSCTQTVGLGGRSWLLDFLGSEGVLDAAAQRLLVFSGVCGWRRVACLSLREDAFLARVDVSGDAGERAILTVRLEREQRLEPAFRSAPRVNHAWRLRSATGDGDAPVK